MDVVTITFGQRVGYATFAILGLVLVVYWRRAGRVLHSALEYLNAPRPQDRPAWRERGGDAYLPIAQAMVLVAGLVILLAGAYATFVWTGD